MKNKRMIVIGAAIMVVAIVVGLVLANVFGGDDKNTSGEVETASTEESSFPEYDPDASEMSIPDIDDGIVPPDHDPDPDADFDEGDFFAYLLDFSLYFHSQLEGQKDYDALEGEPWLYISFVANYAWAADEAGTTDDYFYDDDRDMYGIKTTRLESASEEIFGFKVDYAAQAANHPDWFEDGYYLMTTGHEMMGSSYADLGTSEMKISGSTVTVDVDIVNNDMETGDISTVGSVRYTFLYEPDQEVVPYQLVSIEET